MNDNKSFIKKSLVYFHYITHSSSHNKLKIMNLLAITTKYFCSQVILSTIYCHCTLLGILPETFSLALGYFCYFCIGSHIFYYLYYLSFTLRKYSFSSFDLSLTFSHPTLALFFFDLKILHSSFLHSWFLNLIMKMCSSHSLSLLLDFPSVFHFY